MDQHFSYDNFEDAIAYFKANPPEGGRVELDFTDKEIQYVNNKATQYQCTLDVFMTAVMACFFTHLERKDARAAEQARFAEITKTLRHWIMAETDRQRQPFPDIGTDPENLLDKLFRAACALGFDIEINISPISTGQTGRITVQPPETYDDSERPRVC